jgi:hypothetical protein
MELNILFADDLFEGGYSTYRKFWSHNFTKDIIWAEKTPRYSDDFLTPLRALTVFPHAKFVFTYRDPYEAVVSLFVHRHRSEVSLEKFQAWLQIKIEKEIQYNHCVDLLPKPSQFESHLSLALYETYIYKKCRNEITYEPLSHYFYRRSLERWKFYFGTKFSVACLSRTCIKSGRFREVLDDWMSVNPAFVTLSTEVQFQKRNLTDSVSFRNDAVKLAYAMLGSFRHELEDSFGDLCTFHC